MRPKVLDVKRTQFEDGIDRFIKKESCGTALGMQKYGAFTFYNV